MDQEKRQLKVFGYGLAIICGVVSLKLFRSHGLSAANIVLDAISLSFILLTGVCCNALRPLYQRWMIVAHAIGTVVNGIILTVLFYCVFGIAGIFLRLLRKDLLSQRLEPDARSYWIKKETKEFKKENYLKQF